MKLLIGILVVILLIATDVGSFYWGRMVGIDNYHQTCYNGPPGFVVDEKTGTVVICQGLKSDTPSIVPQRGPGNRNDI